METIRATRNETDTLETAGSLVLSFLLVACVAFVYWLCIVK